MSRSGYRALAANGTEYARRVLRGEEPILRMPFGAFAVELGNAVRPHFFVLSCTAALAGAAADTGGLGALPVRMARSLALSTTLAAVTCGLGWGVGQIVNDLMDRDSDAVNAPERAISAGRLPVGPTLSFAVFLGLAVALALPFVHPLAWVFAPPAALLLVGYNAAKKLPLLGNLAHALLMSIAGAIGVSSRMGSEVSDVSYGVGTFLDRVLSFWPTLALVGATAAWYLQSNYEKDRPGDRVAGYTTLAVVMPVRASAALRAAGIIAIGIGAHRLGLLPDAVSRTTMAVATTVGVASTIGPMLANTDAAALRAYRFAVVASILVMLALAAPLLGRWGTTALLVVALALVRAAFRRSDNP